MRPSDRAIRDELRREAARVAIPQDMWRNIAQELEKDTREETSAISRTRSWRQWVRPAMQMGLVAGVFWLAVVPMVERYEERPRLDDANTPVVSTVSTVRRGHNEFGEPVFPTSTILAPSRVPSRNTNTDFIPGMPRMQPD